MPPRMAPEPIVPLGATGIEAFLCQVRGRLEAQIDHLLPPSQATGTPLSDAMRYAALGGGKRIRAALVYASGELFGAAPQVLDAPAAAVELLHAYSLVHDDLPAMDDDDLRRGKPSCHRAFDEGMAILAGDALHTLAFEALLGPPLPPQLRAPLAAELAQAAGWRGMAGGQAMDLAAVNLRPGREDLEIMHRGKTGALIVASVLMGARCGDGGGDHLPALERFGQALGLSFQVRDDVLDESADTATLGKPSGSDARQGKPTFTALLGLDGAQRYAGELTGTALKALDGLPQRGGYLRDLTEALLERTY